MMISPARLAVALSVAVAVLTTVLASVSVPWPLGAAHAVNQARSCVFTSTHTVRPATVPIDAGLTVTLGLQGTCPDDGRMLHIVFVVDASEQMKDRSRDWLPVLLSDLESALVGLPPDSWEKMEVGVVSFRDRTAETESHLTNGTDDLVRALHDIAVSPGNDCIECGLREGLRKARRLLQAGRADMPSEAFREVIVLASRGFETTRCDAVRAATNEVKPFGILVITACGGGECDRKCLSEAATAESFAFASGEWGYLGTALRQLLDEEGPFHPIESVGIVDELSEMLLYTTGGDPSSAVGNRLEWRFSPWPSDGITRSYAARAVGAGHFRLSDHVSADVRYNDAFGTGFVESVSFENPFVRVLAPTATASTTPTPPVTRTRIATATFTPGPSVTPTVEGAATPSTTATCDPRPGPTTVRTLFLPVALRRGCAPGASRVDVALVIDVSGSMAAADVERMASRWDAAANIAESLVTYYMAGPADRAAVIPFADHAEVRSGLRDGLPQARAKLNRLPRWNGSRMDLAIEAAVRELLPDPRMGDEDSRPDAHKVILLLTDGDLNQAPREQLLRAASDARAAGIQIIAVVLGRDARADLNAMRLITGSESRVLETRRLPVISLVDAAGRQLRCHR
jgi:Mg-chelatase subunit ChlD